MALVVVAASTLTPVSWKTACAGAPRPFAPPSDGELVVYRHAALIDGRGVAVGPDMAVLVAGDRIRAVFPDTVPLPEAAAKAKAVDLRGRYLMPGLVDSHVHLATPPNRRQAEAGMRRNLVWRRDGRAGHGLTICAPSANLRALAWSGRSPGRISTMRR